MAELDLNHRATTAPEHDPTKPLEADSSLGDLLSRLTSDFGGLVSTQVELAKVEIKEELAQAGKGAGLLTGGGLAAYLGIMFLSFAAAWGLDEVMPAAVAFLLVALAWLAVALALYATGRRQLKSVRVAPQSKAAIKEDVQWARQQKN
ncbi:MAG TPA: phage holin family protein [Acidimicrobiales bacterium]|nr:phage holin family protein [Acidimicrobiales bacterium]